MATQAQASAQAATQSLDEQLQASFGGRKLNLNTQELLDLMKQITPGQIAAFRRSIMRMTVDKIDIAEFSIYEYQGFDPKKIMLKFLSVGMHFKMSLTQVINDIMHVIAINLYMGNLAQNKIDRRTPDAKKRLAELVSTYGIRLGSTGTGLTPETITIPRTSAAFPILSTRMATVLPTTETIGMPYKSIGLPRCMKISSFASFLSHNIEQNTRNFLMKCVLAYSADQTTVFSMDKKTRKPTIDPISAYAKQLTYIQASMSSTVPEEWEKGEMLKEFKIHEIYSTLLPIVQNLNHVAGLGDVIPSEPDYVKALNEFFLRCEAEKTQRIKEETLIIAAERAAKAKGGQPPQGPTGGPPAPPGPPSPKAPRQPPPPPPAPTGETVSLTGSGETPTTATTGMEDLLGMVEEKPEVEGDLEDRTDEDIYGM